MIRHCVFLFSVVLAPIAGTQSERPEGPLREEGEIAGAPFRIDIPAEWNGSLLMYAHGYAISGRPPAYNEMMTTVGNELGYAVAQSLYSRQGWAAREGILDTEALRRYVVDTYGATSPVIVAGHSQGGWITFKTIETYPEVYDGALSMCGSSEPALRFFKERVFDMRLLFDYYFPGLPGSVVEFPDGAQTLGKVATKAAELIKADPEGAEKFIQMVNLPTVQSIPGVIGFWSEILREMQERTGGNAFDNRDTIYAGSDDDAKLNREIPRHAADSGAQEYMRQWATITGEIRDPVIVLHTLVDELVPVEATAHYDTLTNLAETSDLYVQLHVAREGHCRFTEDETSEALRRLTEWVTTGKRAEAGDITAAE
jgi:pimeloyl-ACP methyl ester carboxylesterase